MKRIFAYYDDQGVYVYQAFKPEIVKAAVEKGTFGKGFGTDRITWIKPSFGWILHRSDYASKHRMEAIAKIKLSHDAWLKILSNTVPSLFDNTRYESEIKWKSDFDKSDIIHQWDPDRDIDGRKLDRRAIQIGLRGEAIKKYVDEWIIGVEDVTELSKEIFKAIKLEKRSIDFVPELREYPIPEDIKRIIGYS
ncbi:MAG TPA: DUF4291 family protein [Clostridia bacterium]